MNYKPYPTYPPLDHVNIQGRTYKEHHMACPDCGMPMLLRPSAFKAHAVMYQCIRKDCGATHSANADGSPAGTPGNARTRQLRSQVRSGLLALSQQISSGAVQHWVQGVLQQEQVVVSNLTYDQCAIILRVLRDDFNIVSLDTKLSGITEISMGG